VFLLQDAQGRPDPNKVLKATFKLSLGGIAGMTHMEREWAVGRRLAPLERAEKGIPGFMATGAALVTKSRIFKGDTHACHVRNPSLQLRTRTGQHEKHVTQNVMADCGDHPCRLHFGANTWQEL